MNYPEGHPLNNPVYRCGWMAGVAKAYSYLYADVMPDPDTAESEVWELLNSPDQHTREQMLREYKEITGADYFDPRDNEDE